MSLRVAIVAIPFFLALSGCSGGEPSETEMRSAFNRTFRAERGVKSFEIKEFRKMACKASTDRPGHVCDFYTDANATFDYVGAHRIQRNMSGRFFADKDGSLQFALDLRG